MNKLLEQWTQLEIVTGKQGTILMKRKLNSFMNISCKIFFKILYNNSICSVVAGVGFSPPRSVNLPFCHLGLLKGRFSSL